METGRNTALVRAADWGKLGYVLIGHMVDWDEEEQSTLLKGLKRIISYKLNYLLDKNY